jgi:hypothetical protein
MVVKHRQHQPDFEAFQAIADGLIAETLSASDEEILDHVREIYGDKNVLADQTDAIFDRALNECRRTAVTPLEKPSAKIIALQSRRSAPVLGIVTGSRHVTSPQEAAVKSQGRTLFSRRGWVQVVRPLRRFAPRIKTLAKIASVIVLAPMVGWWIVSRFCSQTPPSASGVMTGGEVVIVVDRSAKGDRIDLAFRALALNQQPSFLDSVTPTGLGQSAHRARRALIPAPLVSSAPSTIIAGAKHSEVIVSDVAASTVSRINRKSSATVLPSNSRPSVVN